MHCCPSSVRRFLTLLVAAACAVTATPEIADAQYFGRNKVQYETFDFRILQTDHFDVYYYPDEELAARDAARMAERWYDRYSRLIDYEFEERQPLILYANGVDFRQTSAIGGTLGEGTGGVTEAFKQRIILPLAASYEETDHVVGHELVHAFQYDISGLGRGGAGIEAAARRFQVPLWFTEGMAEYLSIGAVDPNTAMWLRDAALAGRIPTIEQMTRDPRYFPYRWGQAFWAYVGGRWGDAAIGQILKQVGGGVPYEVAFARILNTPLKQVGDDWAASIRSAYLPLLTQQREAREIATPLVTNEDEGGRLNLAPALSPDGTRLAFLSSRSDFDVDLFLADAQTGEVIRTLQKGSNFDAHFASLNYINSAGTFSPDGGRFAFSAVRGGKEVVVVLDARNGKRLREFETQGVGQITSPTWSPDGSTIVFSGLKGGISDLFAIDVESGASRQLTNDRFADLQPAYSPDGGTLAFVSDRGPNGTDFQTLSYGNYELALLDLASGSIRQVPAMEGHKNIDPQWSPDGRSLFFLSTLSGIPNVYRVYLADGRLTRVTNVFAGISGITDLSPALSVASRADRLVFVAYERNGYNLYSLEGDQLAGTPVASAATLAAGFTPVAADTVPAAAVLPPVPRPDDAAFNRVGIAMDNPRAGLPAVTTAQSYPVAPYRPKLSLDYLGQPQIGVSVSSGGFSRGGIYGGINGIFSDQLGYHTLYAAVSSQGQLDEVGGAAIYLNRKHRWSWGAAAQRIPYISGGFQRGLNEDNDIVFRELRQRIFDTAVQGLAQYPFSTNQRLEFAAGPRRISGDLQARDFIFQNVGGFAGGLIDRRDFEVDGSQFGFNLFESSAALVYDNALLGFTSPLAGQRYRLEATPTFGELTYTSALADFRKYFFLRPVTFAVQGLHFGRYGTDAERLFREQFLGYTTFVRGYTFGTVSDECQTRDPTICGDDENSIGNSLFGSRIGVAKAELRFPLYLGTLGRSSALPPSELFAFGDAGVAWNRGQHPVFATGSQDALDERGFLTSAGVGTRVNLFGYFVLEIDYLKAFQLDNGWRFEFALQPGF
ncbi:basic secretory protein-like protein [soil metagenome]